MSKPVRNTKPVRSFNTPNLSKAGTYGPRKDILKPPLNPSAVGANVNLFSATLTRATTSALNSY